LSLDSFSFNIELSSAFAFSYVVWVVDCPKIVAWRFLPSACTELAGIVTEKIKKPDNNSPDIFFIFIPYPLFFSKNEDSKNEWVQ
jgi:hypothetical protein